MWCAAVALTTFAQLQYGKLGFYMKFRYQNIAIWGISILLEVTPFFFSDYYGGCRGGTGWGVVVQKRDISEVYQLDESLLVVPIPLFTSIFISIALLIYLVFVTLPRVWKNGNTETFARVKTLVVHVLFYPFMLVIFWTPNCFYGAFANQLVKSNTIAAQIGLAWTGYVTGAWAYGFGISCSCLFIFKSDEMRARWSVLLRQKFNMAPIIQNMDIKGKKLETTTNSAKNISASGLANAPEVLARESQHIRESSSNVDAAENIWADADFMTDEDYELAYDSRELQMEENGVTLDEHHTVMSDRISQTRSNNPLQSSQRSASSIFPM